MSCNHDLLESASTGFYMGAFMALEHGANDLNGALRAAAAHGRVGMVDYLLSRGADDIRGALAAANAGATVLYVPESGHIVRDFIEPRRYLIEYLDSLLS